MSYAVAVIQGTIEKERADTNFVFGKEDHVNKFIEPNQKEFTPSGNPKAEIILRADTFEEAKELFYTAYGSYNNFDYQTTYLNENGEPIIQ